MKIKNIKIKTLLLTLIALSGGPALAQTSSQLLIDTINTFSVVRGLKVIKDVPYGEHPKQKLDLYLPRQKGTHPVLVFVHGGTWQKYKKDDFKFIGESFARAGYLTVLINYRLYPEVQYPAFVQDTAKAFKWVKDHARDYSGNPERMFLMGHSAGAYNTVMALVNPAFLPAEGLKPTDFKGVVGIAGPYDIPPLDGIFGEEPNRKEVMPVHQVHGDLPPFLLVSAGNDDLVSATNAVRLEQALKNNQTPVSTVTVPNLGHSDVLITLMRRAAGFFTLRDTVLDFMEKQP